MSDKLKENLSALVDGELGARSASETVDSLLASNALRVHWSRYHVVRDVLRHKVYPDADGELCERMRRCLADEALHFPSRLAPPRRWREALKPIAGVALAASVAVVAILAVRSPQQASDQPSAARPATAQAASARVATAQVATARVATAMAPTIRWASATTREEIRPVALRRLQWNSTEPEVVDRLTGYLVDYSEHVGGPITGMHPYARIVGYDTSGQR